MPGSPARRTRLAVSALAALTLLTMATQGGAAATASFPPYVTNPDALPPDVRQAIVTVWTGRTLSRTTTGPTARVPLDLYGLFVDRPDLTAFAGVHLGVGRYRVTRTGPDDFDVEDNDGTQGHYRVILRDQRQLAVLARARRRTRIVGDVRGLSLALLTLMPGTSADGRPQVAQRLETTVRIEHRVVAFIARLLVPLFPDYADRKSSEMFNIAARVSAWAWEQPAEFCAWLGAQPGHREHREAFGHVLPACAKPGG